jgi:hypothetical protein
MGKSPAYQIMGHKVPTSELATTPATKLALRRSQALETRPAAIAARARVGLADPGAGSDGEATVVLKPSECAHLRLKLG